MVLTSYNKLEQCLSIFCNIQIIYNFFPYLSKIWIVYYLNNNVFEKWTILIFITSFDRNSTWNSIFSKIIFFLFRFKNIFFFIVFFLWFGIMKIIYFWNKYYKWIYLYILFKKFIYLIQYMFIYICKVINYL